MKTTIYIFGLVLVILTGCYEKHEYYPVEPIAQFNISDYSVEPGQTVYFTNNSLHADYFEWNFGDGTFSDVINPAHAYAHPGTYSVSLTAFLNGRQAHTVYQTITVLSITRLEITVLEYYDEYAVADASIILYPTLQDWYDETNPVIEVFTNYYGVAVIEDLPPSSYYVDVWHPEHNNYILAEEDVRYIRIPPLTRYGVNYFTAWVDYVPEGWKKKGATLKGLTKGRSFNDKIEAK